MKKMPPYNNNLENRKLQNVDVQNICIFLTDYNHANRNTLIRLTARGEIVPECNLKVANPCDF